MVQWGKPLGAGELQGHPSVKKKSPSLGDDRELLRGKPLAAGQWPIASLCLHQRLAGGTRSPCIVRRHMSSSFPFSPSEDFPWF